MFSIKRLSDLSPILARPLKYSLIITGCITVLSVSALFFLQPEIPIFYSLPLIPQQIAPRLWILLFPSLSVATTLLHIVIIGVLKSIDQEVLRIFCWLTMIFQLLLLAILVRLLILIV